MDYEELVKEADEDIAKVMEFFARYPDLKSSIELSLDKICETDIPSSTILNDFAKHIFTLGMVTTIRLYNDGFLK